MLISYNWLKQFTNLDNISPQTLAEKLTLHSVEVEEVIELGANLDNIVVGRVESVQDHPNADALKICTVAFGNDYPVQIVCGGSNVTEGMLCALGCLGAKVKWHGEGELIELKKAKIRGVESYGMICAAEEIGLGSMFPKEDEKEILDLSHYFPERPPGVEGSHGSSDASGATGSFDSGRAASTQEDIVGMPLKQALQLDDVLIDVENKTMTHRPDLWGHYGMAREVSAIVDTKLDAYKTSPITAGKEKKLSVSIDTDYCHRYMGVMIDSVTVQESPDWMKQRLSVVGVTPKNNLVDITNYVMIELGQPMHAFDASRLETTPNDTKSKNQNIVVRQAEAEEQFTALGGKEYVLTTEDMVITSGGKVVALAGVKGDEFSGVTDTTTSILLEAATFDPVTVRRAATRHGLRTDASARFEKSLDTNLAEIALRRAVELVLELCPEARVVSNVADETTKATKEMTIDLDLTYLRERIGVDLTEKEIIKTLEALGFGVKGKKDTLKVTVPTWRATKDVSIQEDLIEEVARMYGYNNVPVALPVANIAPPATDSLREMEKQLTKILVHECGYTEVYNYSFVAPEYLEKLGLSTDDHLELNNPVAKDRPYLRKYLFPNMLQNVESNLHRFDSVSLFEIGRVFEAVESDDMTAQQATKFVAMFAAKGVDTPYFELRTVLDRVTSDLGLEISLVPVAELPSPWDSIVHPGRVASIMVGEQMIGSISELHPVLQETLGIPHRVASLELNVDTLAALVTENTTYEPIASYPSVERDISFLVDAAVAHARVVQTVRAIDHHIRSVDLIDVYVGDHVPVGKKSMTYRIEYRCNEKTMETKEVETIHGQVIDELVTQFQIEVR